MKNVVLTLILIGTIFALSAGEAAAEPATKADVERLEKQIEDLKQQVHQLQGAVHNHGGQMRMGMGMKKHQKSGDAAGGMGGQQMPMMDDDMNMPMGNPPAASQDAPMGQSPSGGMGHM